MPTYVYTCMWFLLLFSVLIASYMPTYIHVCTCTVCGSYSLCVLIDSYMPTYMYVCGLYYVCLSVDDTYTHGSYYVCVCAGGASSTASGRSEVPAGGDGSERSALLCAVRSSVWLAGIGQCNWQVHCV